MAQQISRIQNRITLIFGVATAAATVFLMLVIPVVADLTPEAARSVRLHCLILGPLAMVGIIIALRLYLRPISDLGYALEIGSTPTVELTQSARKIALCAPLYFFVLPTAGGFVAGLIINVLGCLLWCNYVFGERLLAVLLSTAITACGALVVALVCRRYMRPVLLYTAPPLQDSGFRLNIRARLLAATLTLIVLALFFPGGYALTRVVDAYREQLADTALVYLADAVEHGTHQTEEQVLDDIGAHLAGSVEYDHLFTISSDGDVLDQRSPGGTPLTFDPELWLQERPRKLRQASTYFVLVPMEATDQARWVAMGYPVHPLRSGEVVRTVAALGASGALAFALAVLVSHYLAADITMDLRDVTSRLLDIAHDERVDLSSPLPVLSIDEVGDLILAYNALQQRVQGQQEQIAYKQRQLIALQSLSYKIGTARDVDHLLSEVIRDVERAFGYHNVSILLADNQRDELYFTATGLTDAALRGRRFKIGQDGVVGRVAATGQSMMIDDVSTCDFYISDKTNTRSELAVPLIVGDQVMGVFNVSSERIGAFEENDLRIVTALSNQVAIAIENARLFSEVVTNANELERRAQNLTILHDVSTALSTSLRTEDALRTVAEQLVSLCKVGHCAVVLFDEKEEHAQVVAEYPDQGVAGQQVLLREFPVVQRMLAAPQPLFIADAQRSEQLRPMRESMTRLNVHAALIVPLTTKGHVEGFILLSSIGEPRLFTPDEIDICQTISAQVAVSVENVRLIDNLRMQADALARMAHDIAAERGQLDAILRNLVDGLLVADPEGHIILFNPAFLHLFGLSEQGLKGQLATSVVPELPLPELATQIGRAAVARAQEMALPDGRHFQVTAAGVREGNELHAIIMVLRDVTRERQLDEIKSDFISTVSHELRTPLTPVLGFAKLVQKAFNKSIRPVLPAEGEPQRVADRIDQNLDILITEVDHLSKLVDDVLFLADMDAGRLKWRMAQIDLSQILEHVVTEYRAEAEAKGIELCTAWPDDLPQAYGDRTRLARVIRNLLSNAIKFTDEGKVSVYAQQIRQQDNQWKTPPCVNVPEQLTPGSYVLVAVCDTGTGISAQAQQTLFERFGQGVRDVLTEKPSGTQLGLALSKEIVSHHSGRIWVESEPGKGSTFAFVLPLSVESVERPFGAAGPSLPDTAPTVLVVDDEPGIRELLYYMLHQAGYHTLMAVDGRTALNMTRGQQPDLIILDIMIPGLGGLDVMSVLKADESTRHIPIIILSVVADKERAAQLGADACFAKPFKQDVLVDKIAELLAARSANAAD